MMHCTVLLFTDMMDWKSIELIREGERIQAAKEARKVGV